MYATAACSSGDLYSVDLIRGADGGIDVWIHGIGCTMRLSPAEAVLLHSALGTVLAALSAGADDTHVEIER